MPAYCPWFFIFIYKHSACNFWCFFYRTLSLHLTGTHKNFRSYLPGIFFRIQIQFFTMPCADNPISFLRCCDGRRSFPGLYRQSHQSPAALFMDGNLPRSLGPRQLYLCRDIASARFISCRPPRVPDIYRRIVRRVRYGTLLPRLVFPTRCHGMLVRIRFRSWADYRSSGWMPVSR